MEWGKFVLLFQAVVTLVIGMVLLLQMFTIEDYKAKKLDQLQSLDSSGNLDISQLPQFSKLQDLSSRFQTGSYILLIVSLIEIILISRLMV